MDELIDMIAMDDEVSDEPVDSMDDSTEEEEEEEEI